ncbi:MAG: hypothetical protein SCM96_11320 [Acidobacteriota bacterium]|nr:hypothetical protein [Acidobacteriota bacterium]
MKKFTIVAATLIGLATAIQAADNLTLSFFQSYTDNLFQTSFPEKDGISNLAFSFDKSFAPFSFFTEGRYSHLNNNTNIGSYAQNAGIDYLRPVNEKTAFYLSARLGGVLYRSDFSDFNFFHFAAVGAVKSYLTPQSILNVNAVLEFRNTRDPLFDYLSSTAAVTIDRYFDSRTTLKGEAQWGFKYFLHPFQAQASTVQTSFASAGGGQGPGGGRMGWRSGFISPQTDGRGQGIQIASLSGLVAQGIGDHFGLRVSALRQWTLSGENPFVSIEEFYMVENPSYDVFSWNGFGISGLATVLIPWNMQLKIGYTSSSKKFPGIEAMDLDGRMLSPLRRDTRKQWDARLEKNFPVLNVFVGFSHVDNRSNDLLFNWKGLFLTAGIDWTFNWGGKT